MTKDDGGPAFPNQPIPPGEGTFCDQRFFWSHKPATPGMTLRQWYAGLAMQGFIINPATIPLGVSVEGAAARQADTMIEGEKK